MTISPQNFVLPEKGFNWYEYFTHLEQEVADQAILRARGNLQFAGEILNLHRTTLIMKLKLWYGRDHRRYIKNLLLDYKDDYAKKESR